MLDEDVRGSHGSNREEEGEREREQESLGRTSKMSEDVIGKTIRGPCMARIQERGGRNGR